MMKESSKHNKVAGSNFPSLNRRPLAFILAIEACSQAAFAMSQVTLPWFILQTTNDAGLAGVVMLALFGPAFLGSWLGGNWVDRHGAARVSLCSEIISATTLAGLAILAVTDQLSLVGLVTLLLVMALVDPAGFIAREALIPPMARRARVPLAQANSLREGTTQCVRIAAPLCAGALITYAGMAWAWLAIAGMAVGSAVLTAGLLSRRSARRSVLLSIATAGAKDGTVANNQTPKGGVLSDPILRWLLVVTVPLAAIDEPLESVVLPTYLFRSGASALSMGGLDAAFNVGALAGIALFGWLSKGLAGRHLLLVCGMAVSVTLLVFAAEAPYAVLLGASACCGAAGGAVGPFLMTQVQQRAPRATRGRTLASLAMFEMGGAVVGIGLSALFIERLGTTVLLMGFAGVAAMAAALSLRLPKNL